MEKVKIMETGGILEIVQELLRNWKEGSFEEFSPIKFFFKSRKVFEVPLIGGLRSKSFEIIGRVWFA